MMIIESFKYAPEFIKNVAKAQNFNPTAYAIFSMYDRDSKKYPALRDRTEEMSRAVKGMSDNTDLEIMTLTGRELAREYGFNAVGAQFVTNFRIIFG
jgi:hypothetical protein